MLRAVLEHLSETILWLRTFLRCLGHLDISTGRTTFGKLALKTKLGLCNPYSEANQCPHNSEYNHNGQRDAKHVRGHQAASTNLVVVQEAVRIPALIGKSDKRQRQIGQQNDNQPEQVNPGRRLGARQHELKERKGRVEGVLADVGPGVEADGEPGRRVQHGPVDNSDEKGQRDNGGVIERVKRLQDAREAVEQRGVGVEGVGERVDGGDGKVEG